MSMNSNRKKHSCSFFVVIFIIVSIFIMSVIMSFIYEPTAVLLPTKVIEMFLLYDHIEYDGIDYYFYEPSKKLKGITPDFDKEVEVIIANSNCRPYGKNTVAAYLCENDSDHIYIYYDSCYFVSDKSLASKPWNGKETEDGSVPCEKSS